MITNVDEDGLMIDNEHAFITHHPTEPDWTIGNNLEFIRTSALENMYLVVKACKVHKIADVKDLLTEAFELVHQEQNAGDIPL
jgi:hypothetical protein